MLNAWSSGGSSRRSTGGEAREILEFSTVATAIGADGLRREMGLEGEREGRGGREERERERERERRERESE